MLVYFLFMNKFWFLFIYFFQPFFFFFQPNIKSLNEILPQHRWMEKWPVRNNSRSDEGVFCVTCEGFGKKVQSCFYHICSNSSDRWHFSGQRWSIKVQCHLKSMEKIITEQQGAVQRVPFYSLCNSRLDAPALWGTTARAGSDHLLQGPSKGESSLIATCTLTSSPSFRESSVSSFLGRNQKHHHKVCLKKVTTKI